MSTCTATTPCNRIVLAIGGYVGFGNSIAWLFNTREIFRTAGGVGFGAGGGGGGSVTLTVGALPLPTGTPVRLPTATSGSTFLLDKTAPGGAGGIGCAAVLIVVGTLFGLEVLSSNTVRSGTVTGRSGLDVSR